MRIMTFLYTLVLALPQVLNAQVTCDTSTGLICVEAVQNNSSVTFWAENHNPLVPVTLSMSYELRNLTKPSHAEGPFVIRGETRIKLATLEAKAKGSWRYDYSFVWNLGDINAHPNRSYRYRLPYAKDRAFSVVQSCNGSFSHQGLDRYALDFLMPIGTPVFAARAGRIVALKSDSNNGGASEAFRDAGNFVTIEHDDSTLAQYYHLELGGVSVQLGDYVARGAQIGTSGNTGYSTGPHLHFEVIKGAVGMRSQTLPITFATHAGPQLCPPIGAKLRVVQ